MFSDHHKTVRPKDTRNLAKEVLYIRNMMKCHKDGDHVKGMVAVWQSGSFIMTELELVGHEVFWRKIAYVAAENVSGGKAESLSDSNGDSSISTANV